MTPARGPSHRRHRKARVLPITEAKAPKAPSEATRAAYEARRRFKEGAGPGEVAATDADGSPSQQNGIRTRAPSKSEREALPPFRPILMKHIHIPRSLEALAEARSALLSAEVLGFDTESRPLFIKGQRDHGGPHLVQLATVTDAWLLMIHHVPGALALARDVMTNPSILKVGFGLVNDVRELPSKLGAQLENVCDLDKRFAKFGFHGQLGIRGAVAVVYKQNLRKAKRLTLANWAAEDFTPAMIQYAANDAHVPALLWAEMARWTEGEVDTRKWFEAGLLQLRRDRQGNRTSKFGLRSGTDQARETSTQSISSGPESKGGAVQSTPAPPMRGSLLSRMTDPPR
ncbi:ribonuclease H-like protein [Cutaneotrichosporon oleaginosum]|uniref:3'-5' exonuclease n=1 Tax=Cutaneotrichosporon oleaginosum TaxID=879819 RepID=A0A0J0XMV7_9TREE|nr:ribonuclease H-like protein [Cutaneotrichosporon oleaginosum]KLT42422.1 ribonuclease H-like protein [Cutaneotrichosporon oleaginosum]TXT06941.1 hypothetical protein COLE_06272 [Cutaneotrichosporon oleaginosum]